MEEKESKKGQKQEGEGTKEERARGRNDKKGKNENNEPIHTKGSRKKNTDILRSG